MNIMKIKNESGFTLVEVMVAVGLLGGLAVAGMSLFKNQNKAQKNVEKNYEVTTIANEIRNVLSTPANCLASLNGVNPSGGAVTYLKKEINSVLTDVYPVNTKLPGDIKINSYGLVKTHPSLQANETILQITFSKGKSVIREESVRQIKIIYSPAAGPISTCYAASSANDTIWEQSSVDINDIFYMTGDVGVGTAIPQSRLHVMNGNLQVGDSMMAGTSNSDLLIFSSPGNNTDPMYIYRENAGLDISRLKMIIGDNPETQSDAFMISSTTTNVASFYSNGNIGFGTTNPVMPLHISKATSGAMGPSIILDNPANTTGDSGALIFYDSASAQPYRGALNWVVQAGGTPSFNIMTGTSNSLSGMTSRLTVAASGEVGINNSSPLYPLHVVSANNPIMRIDSSNTTNGPRFELNSTATNGRRYVMLSGQTGDTPGAGSFDIYDATAGADRFVINRFGYVGINSPTPAYRFDVNGPLNATQYIWKAGVNWSMVDASGEYSFDFADSSGFAQWCVWNPSAGCILAVKSNGRVGIGTALPTNRFSIMNTFIVNDDGDLSVTGGADARWALYHNGSERMAIESTGTVTFSGAVVANSFMYSDKRLKKKISPLESALDRILNLHGRAFVWKDTNREDIGFVAQEVEEFEPALVHTDGTGMKSVAYQKVIAIAVEAIRELKEENMELKIRIENLEKKSQVQP